MSALPFGQERVQALLTVLVLFCLQPEGFRNRQLRPLLARMLGISETQISPGRLSYELRRLRLHGLIERIPKTQRYRLTIFGLKTALFYSRTYQRLLRRGLSELHDPRTSESSTLALDFAQFQKTLDAHAAELRRQEEVFLNGLGAERIPDPTTAGDFTRRFSEQDIASLQECFNRARLKVWKVQPEGFLKEAFIDVDGTIAGICGECKQGIGLSYKGDRLGLEPQSVVGIADARSGARDRVSEDGISALFAGDHLVALPSCADGPESDLPDPRI